MNKLKTSRKEKLGEKNPFSPAFSFVPSSKNKVMKLKTLKLKGMET